MHTATNTTSTPHPGTLTALRTLGRGPHVSLWAALHQVGTQARLLRALLPRDLDQIAARLNDLIPAVLVEPVDGMPMPGTSLWADGRWLIQVRASDPADTQDFAALHQLKHVIDHPLRREQPDLFSELEWELLADRFACQVLADERQPVAVSGKEERP